MSDRRDVVAAGKDVDESLVAIRAFDKAIEADRRPGDVAQALLLAGEAVVHAIRELGLRLEYVERDLWRRTR